MNALYFGGISICRESGAEAYRSLAGRAAKDRVIMPDSNIRPGFISDEARYRARLDQMIALSAIVKVSCKDLDWIYSDSGSDIEKAERLRVAGPAVVIFALGSEGAVAIGVAQDPICVSAQKAKVVETIAAGATINGGFLARLDQLGVLSKPN